MSEIRVVIPDKVDKYIDSLVRTGMFSSKAELFRAALMEYLESVSSVAKNYDSKIIFSPEGRIYQIEYAAEASLRGLRVAGLVFKDGILFAHPEYVYRDADGRKFTLSPNLRPLGTSLMMGIKNEMKIVVFDPSGRYFYTKFWALGDGYREVITHLNREYRKNLAKEDAINLIKEILGSEKIVYEII